MTAHRTSLAKPATDLIEEARAHVGARALTPSTLGAVGLELEFHLVDLRRPARRLPWEKITALIEAIPPLPEGSRVSVEPGGQIELSTPPGPGVAAAVLALRRDQRVLAQTVREAGVGLASIGSDLARPVRRVSPAGRYIAMERHFDALGCGPSGRAMMASTAALQVNVEAGPRSGWSDRVNRIQRLGPVLVAMSACSPLLAGHASGWQSMRQQVWSGIDPERCRPLPATADPVGAWVSYVLSAPVMLVRNQRDGSADPVTGRVPYAAWAGGSGRLGRAPTLEDLDYHLSTLFPPLRPRGYLEIRYLDALPNRWWPALAALAVTLIDDEVAADRAAELCEPVADAWMPAARDGLRDPKLLAAARGCVDVAARRCPPELRPDVEAYAEMVTRGRSPGDELRERVSSSNPLAVLEEEAHA
jgi:glutamate--cysteine ligase